MANNEMCLVHRPTGLAICLAKRMGGAWHVWINQDFVHKLNAFFQATYCASPICNRDDFVVALEDIEYAPEGIPLDYNRLNFHWK